MNPILAFWFAYIVTRPLGASFADWFSKPPGTPGCDLGDGTVCGIGLLTLHPIVDLGHPRPARPCKPDTTPIPAQAALHAAAARDPELAGSRARLSAGHPGRHIASNNGLNRRNHSPAAIRTATKRARAFARRHETLVDVAVALAARARELRRAGCPGPAGSRRHDRVLRPAVRAAAVRGRMPSLCFALVAGVAFAQWLTSTPQIADASVLVSFLLVRARRRRRSDRRGRGRRRGRRGHGGRCAGRPTDVLKYWVGLTALGVAVRRPRASRSVSAARSLASLQERAARLEFERDQEGRLGARPSAPGSRGRCTTSSRTT